MHCRFKGSKKANPSPVPPKSPEQDPTDPYILPIYFRTLLNPDKSPIVYSSSSQTALVAESPDDITPEAAAVWASLKDWSNDYPVASSSSLQTSSHLDLYLESLISSNPAGEYITSIMNSMANQDINLGDQEENPPILSNDGSVDDPMPLSQSSPMLRIPTKPVQRGQRVHTDHSHLHDLCESPVSPLDFNSQKLLAYILGSNFYLSDQLDPDLGTEEGSSILRYLEETAGVTFPQRRIKRGTHLLALLTDPTQRKCLICEKEKTTAQRALECVRSHLGHRPIRCPGASHGCQTCRAGEQPMRFFSQRLLKEHFRSAQRAICPEPTCNANLCQKGLRRHWDSAHPGSRFPDT